MSSFWIDCILANMLYIMVYWWVVRKQLCLKIFLSGLAENQWFHDVNPGLNPKRLLNWGGVPFLKKSGDMTIGEEPPS